MPFRNQPTLGSWPSDCRRPAVDMLGQAENPGPPPWAAAPSRPGQAGPERAGAWALRPISAGFLVATGRHGRTGRGMAWSY